MSALEARIELLEQRLGQLEDEHEWLRARERVADSLIARMTLADDPAVNAEAREFVAAGQPADHEGWH